MTQVQDPATDRRREPRPGARERRATRPVRDHVAALFNALRDELSKNPENARLAMGLKAWRRPEDVMLDCPTLVPLALEMTWRRRNDPAFQPLFLRADGTPAAETSDVLALSNASYSQLVLACLTAAARITCARREQEWLAAERSKSSLLGGLARMLGASPATSTQRLLKNYSRRGLLEALKPHLVDAAQFEALTSYAMLSTRTAETLGGRLRGMTDAPAIETFAGLDEPASRFAIALADAYADTLSGAAPAAMTLEEDDGLGDAHAVTIDISATAGRALTALLADGTAILKNAMAERKAAQMVLHKMANILGKDVWQVMSHAGHVQDMARCSAPIAFGFGAAAAVMDPAVARALDGINDDAVALYFALQLVETCGTEKIKAWVGPKDIQVWRSVVMDINTSFLRPTPGAELSETEKAAIRDLCAGMAERFVVTQPETAQVADNDDVAPVPQALHDAHTGENLTAFADPPENKFVWSEFVHNARKKMLLR